MSKNLTCLVCPRGCSLTVSDDLKVSGNFCPRGIPYALQEMKEPRRNVTYAIRVAGQSELLPVRTSAPIAKELIFPLTHILKNLVVQAPLGYNEVVVENVLNSGVNIITSRPLNVK